MLRDCALGWRGGALGWRGGALGWRLYIGVNITAFGREMSLSHQVPRSRCLDDKTRISTAAVTGVFVVIGVRALRGWGGGTYCTNRMATPGKLVFTMGRCFQARTEQFSGGVCSVLVRPPTQSACTKK